MNHRDELLARLAGQGDGQPLFLPDLTLWYDWHTARDTLPAAWAGLALPDIARALGQPAWLPVQPWQVEMQGVTVRVQQDQTERVTEIETPAGTLRARRALGPDGDWWQVEYPVKQPADLSAALHWATARVYVVDAGSLAAARQAVGDDGLVAVTLPRRPYSDLLHDLLGWGEGLMLLGEPLVGDILAALEAKLRDLVPRLAGLPADLVLAPDNLDGQFISPRAFARHLAGSYGHTAGAVHEQGKRLVVHVGGAVRNLLAPLAAAGVDAVEGVCGPPQSNASLAEARQIAGPGLGLWGGIAQDFLQPSHGPDEFEAAVRQAAADARGDRAAILGVADRVPVDADLERLAAIPGLLR